MSATNIYRAGYLLASNPFSYTRAAPIPQRILTRASSNVPNISTRKLIDRYSTKGLNSYQSKDFSDANKSIRGKENVRLAKSMQGHSKPLNNLRSDEDPFFKKSSKILIIVVVSKFHPCRSIFKF